MLSENIRNRLREFHIVSYEIPSGHTEAITLDRWIDIELDLYIKKSMPESGHVIAGIHLTREEAEAQVRQIEAEDDQ